MSDKGEQKYYVKVTLEAGKIGQNEPYQETVFIQRYDTHEQQIEEQQALFPAVAQAVTIPMTEAGTNYLNGRGSSRGQER